MEIQSIKQRFDIIGDDPGLNRALDIAAQVAVTDVPVLVTGESGVGKEAIPKIIHQNSPRKHGAYVPINCGAIPEGTIDSELFGHVKGSFTGAIETRKGYFEEADGGTIFLDEIAELPLPTQARLLRVLQSGEFYKVGSSKVQKTNVRVVAATNVNLVQAVQTGKFREDLYYRLNSIKIQIPALRERKGDINLLFRKFAVDFSERYKMPAVRLSHDAQVLLQQYRWPGNIRQLKSVADSISVLEQERTISAETLQRYLPEDNTNTLPALNSIQDKGDFISDRNILFNMIFQLKQEVAQLKEQMNRAGAGQMPQVNQASLANQEQAGAYSVNITAPQPQVIPQTSVGSGTHIQEASYTAIDKDFEEVGSEEREIEPQVLSIPSANEELIRKCLQKHNGRRKDAAAELGISERTLYRKIKEYNL